MTNNQRIVNITGAKSSVGINTPKESAIKAPTQAFFYAFHLYMVGCMGGLLSPRLSKRSHRNLDPVQPTAILIQISAGGSFYNYRRAFMSKTKQHLAYYDIADDSINTAVQALNQITNLLSANQDKDLLDSQELASLLHLVQIELEQLHFELHNYYREVNGDE